MIEAIRRAACVAVLVFASCGALATAMNPSPSVADAFELRLKKLETELRCLVCQNQTLADSSADLAADLRREVRDLALAGKTDDEIRAYLVARYGDFILYDPPLNATTSLLWLGPFALLLVGGALWWLVIRRRASAVRATTASSDEQAAIRARALLDAQDDLPA